MGYFDFEEYDALPYQRRAIFERSGRRIPNQKPLARTDKSVVPHKGGRSRSAPGADAGAIPQWMDDAGKVGAFVGTVATAAYALCKGSVVLWKGATTAVSKSRFGLHWV